MLGQHLILNVIGFPIFLVEILYIPLIFKYGSKVLKSYAVHQTPCLFLLEIMLVVSLAFGILSSKSPTLVFDYRSIIYLLIVFHYVRKNGIDIDLNTILYINLFAVLSEAVYVLYISQSVIVSSMNIIAVATTVIVSFMCEKYIFGILAFAACFVMGIISGYRAGIIFSVAALLVAIAYTIVRSDRSKNIMVRVKRVLFLLCIVFLFVIVIANYMEIVTFIAEKTGMDQFAIFRVTERMEGVLSGDFSSAQEAQRFEIWAIPFDDFFSCIIPPGLTRRQGIYIDAPIVYLYDIFGTIAAWLIVAFFIVKIFSSIKLAFAKSNKSVVSSNRALSTYAMLMSPIIAALFIINGTFINNVYQAIETGIILGILCSKSKNV